jgi:RNA polymerase sigma-70 factor (ECF subfamily)
VLGGDTDTYAELVRRHQAKVIGICRTLLQDEVQADDAAQDIFVKVFELLSQFRRTAAFPTWLHRIATNFCLDIKRRQRRDRTESWDFTFETGDVEMPVSVDNENPELRFEKKELVQTYLSALSEKDRIVLLMREAQGFRYQELADVLECSLDAVKARLKRARAFLMEKFSEVKFHGS